MPLVFGIIVIIFGAIVGSFLNVIIIRLNNQPNKNSRSKCLYCNKVLGWQELFPIISFIVQKGRCKNCHCKISSQYILIEMLTPLLFVLVFFRGGMISFFNLNFQFWLLTIFLWLISSLLVLITAYDIKHKIVPIQFSSIFVVLAFASLFFSVDTSSLQIFFSDILAVFVRGQFWAGPFVAIPFLLLWVISKGKWIGFGDIILMLGIGWLLGISGGFTAILIAFWSATLFLFIICVPAILLFKKELCNLKKGSIMKGELPLVPFLSLGIFIVLITNIDIFNFLGLW